MKHIYKNKKGQYSQVMILLIILASAIIILLFITKFVTKSTIDESINACRLSVMTQAATTYGIITKTSPLDINCDKRYVNFYNTRAELGLIVAPSVASPVKAANPVTFAPLIKSLIPIFYKLI